MQFRKFEKLVLSVALTLAALSGSAAQAGDVVVVVSAKSSVGHLTPDQVGQIFLSKTVAYPGGETATPVDLSEGAAREEFYMKVTGKDQSQLKAYWSQLLFTGKAKRPKAVPDDAEVKKTVAANPGMIGYISKGAVDSSIKVVLAP